MKKKKNVYEKINTPVLLNASDNTIVPVKINNKIFTERAVNFATTATYFHSENRPVLLHILIQQSRIGEEFHTTSSKDIIHACTSSFNTSFRNAQRHD